MSVSRKSSERATPIHPGELLRENFMKPLGLSPKTLAAALRVPARRVSEIAAERRSPDAEMVLRLARYFSMSPEFWMRIQMRYELETAEDTMAARVRSEIKPVPRDRKSGELKPANGMVMTTNAGAFGKLRPGSSTRSREKIGANSLRMTK